MMIPESVIVDELADAAAWVDRRIAAMMAEVEQAARGMEHIARVREVVERRRVQLAQLRAVGLARLEGKLRAAAGRLH